MAEISIDQVRLEHRQAAELMLRDPVFAPIFERYEAELRRLSEAAPDDPISRARAALISLNTSSEKDSRNV